MKRKKDRRGRPKGEKTVVKRIPEAIEPAVDKLADRHRQKLKRAITKFSALDVPKSKRKIFKEIEKPLKALVKDLI